MAQLTIRRIDDALYRRLKERAKLNGRSLEAEARLILKGAAIPDRAEIIRWSAALRARLARRYRGDATAAIREDRGR